LFCSCVEGDFSRFLKQEKFLQTKSFTASQFVALFSLMCYAPTDSRINNYPEQIDDSVKDLKGLIDYGYDKEKPPKMREITGGIEVIFWEQDIYSDDWQKSTVRVLKDYTVTHQIEEVNK